MHTSGAAPIMDRFVSVCNDVLSDEGLRVRVEDTADGQKRITAEPKQLEDAASAAAASNSTTTGTVRRTRLRDRLAFQNILLGGNLLGLTKFRETPATGKPTDSVA